MVIMASGIARGRVRTTAATTVESRNMAAILQITGWRHGGKTADWLKNPLSSGCLGACSSAFHWQFAGASFENVWTFCKREHRKARIILDFCPDRTSTCRREWGLSNSKYVSNVSLVLSLSSSVIPYVIISFVGWCRVQISVPSTASGSICFVYLQYTFCCRFWCTDDLTQWTHHNWKVSQVFLSFLS